MKTKHEGGDPAILSILKTRILGAPRETSSRCLALYLEAAIPHRYYIDVSFQM